LGGVYAQKYGQLSKENHHMATRTRLALSAIVVVFRIIFAVQILNVNFHNG